MPLALTIWLHALMIVVVTYLLGSIPSGYLLMRFFRKQDIRTIGSGNIGATNVMRSGARGLGAATFLFDFLKGSLAVLVGARLASVGFPAFQLHYAEALAAVCVVLGHMFPIWLGLRGGKGVATAFGAFVILVPLASAGALLVFVVVFALGRYVSLASILGAIAFPAFAWFTAPWSHIRIVIGAIAIVVALVLIKHAANIQRLMAGTEYRFGSGKKSTVSNQSGPPNGANNAI